MMQDMSTRRLKRELVKSLKDVWFWKKRLRGLGATPHSDRNDLARASSRLAGIKEELGRRGWPS